MKYRNPVVVALLTLITLGIYGIYWLYKTRLEIIRKNGDPNSIPRVLILFLPFIAIIAFIPFLAITSINDSGVGAIVNLISIVVGILSIFAMIIIPFWWFYRYNMAVARLTRKTEGWILYFIWIVSWVIGIYIIWPAIVQNDLNKSAKKPAIPDTPYPPHPSMPSTPPAAANGRIINA